MVKELKHTEFGDIPSDWSIQTFEETFKVLSNNTLSRDNLNYRGGAVRNIHYGDILIKFSEVLNCEKDEIPYVNDLSLLTSSTQLLQDGDVIIADTAEDDTVGKVTEVQHLADKKLVSGLHTIPCRVKKGEFVPGWLGYYMNSQLYHNQILPFVTGIKVSSISKSAIAETLILIPPKDIQEDIVKGLLDVDELISALEKEIEKKKNIGNTLLDELLTGKRRLVGFDGEWTIQCMKNYVDFQVGFPFDSNLFNNDGVGLRLIKNRDLKSDDQVYYTNEDVSLDYLVNDGDILVGMDGEFIPCLWKKGKALLNQRVGRLIFKKKLYPVFAYYAFQKPLYKLQNGTGATTVKHLSHGDIQKLEILMPPTIEEQIQIATLLLEANQEIEVLNFKSDKYKKIKQGMMNDLLTGKIRLA